LRIQYRQRNTAVATRELRIGKSMMWLPSGLGLGLVGGKVHNLLRQWLKAVVVLKASDGRPAGKRLLRLCARFVHQLICGSQQTLCWQAYFVIGIDEIEHDRARLVDDENSRHGQSTVQADR